MYKAVTLGAIGVKADSLDEALAAAKSVGFTGLDFSIGQVAALGAEAAKQKFDAAGIRAAVFGVPFEWRREEDKWKAGLAELPKLAAAAQAVGCTRCATWIMPASNEMEFDEMFQFHVERFLPIAETLGEHGISLGLEFVGPKTLRSQFKNEFIYSAEGMMELAEKIGTNVGLLLDTYHWYTSHGTLDGLKKLKAENIVYVHLNDAPTGREVDEQMDGDRRLPGSTGVIATTDFMKALDAMGYDGPAACEPFFSGLKEMASDAERLAAVKASVDKVFAAAGVTEN